MVRADELFPFKALKEVEIIEYAMGALKTLEIDLLHILRLVKKGKFYFLKELLSR